MIAKIDKNRLGDSLDFAADHIAESLQKIVKAQIQDLVGMYNAQVAWVHLDEDNKVQLKCSDFANELGDCNGASCRHDLEGIFNEFIVEGHSSKKLKAFSSLLRKYADLADREVDD